MSINSAHNRLKRAERDLVIRWEATQQHWRDENARQFAEERLEPLLERARAAHEALVHLEAILTGLRHDCE
ncbi:MAG: hypothetical protein HY718_22050 [Planctomycetes bacterium]|nr:hypothetical protein [Planctomycetota bacterium]